MQNKKTFFSYIAKHRIIRSIVVVLLTVFILFSVSKLFGFFDLAKETNPAIDVISEKVEELNIKPGETLSTIFENKNFSHRDALAIDKILRNANKTNISERDRIKITTTEDGQLSNFTITFNDPRQNAKNIERIFEISRDDKDNWVLSKNIETKYPTYVIIKTGKVKKGESFSTAATKAGVPANIVQTVYEQLCFDIDFEREVYPDDEFAIMYETYQVGDNESGLVPYYFNYKNNKTGKNKIDLKMYRYEKSNSKTANYYDENGHGVSKSLKKTPLGNAKVTSNFTTKRKHPVLGFTRAHKGVDFRAATGTPIPASGSGKIVKRAYDRGYGNYIRIRHNNTYDTLYGHLSRFAKGIKVGSHVNQGQIIGYAGATGLATGPHLHYEVIKNGIHINPLTLKLPSIENLTKSELAAFKTLQTNLHNYATLKGSGKLIRNIRVPIPTDL